MVHKLAKHYIGTTGSFRAGLGGHSWGGHTVLAQREDRPRGSRSPLHPPHSGLLHLSQGPPEGHGPDSVTLGALLLSHQTQRPGKALTQHRCPALGSKLKAHVILLWAPREQWMLRVLLTCRRKTGDCGLPLRATAPSSALSVSCNPLVLFQMSQSWLLGDHVTEEPGGEQSVHKTA